jgi:hypothetical protein
MRYVVALSSTASHKKANTSDLAAGVAQMWLAATAQPAEMIETGTSANPSLAERSRGSLRRSLITAAIHTIKAGHRAR